MHLAFWNGACLGLLVVDGSSTSFDGVIALDDEIEYFGTFHGEIY